VGILEVPDGTGNVIPGECAFTVDIRAPDDATCEATQADAFARIAAIAARRGVAVELSKTHGVAAAPCAAWLQERLAASVARAGVEPRRLASGAGHDAMIFAQACDAAMLFVRCGAGGVSHNPNESVTPADAGIAAAALLDFLERFEPRPARA
jgi:allantoate deiminase/N-carbamoyl-L-amino-acid hydrolase